MHRWREWVPHADVKNDSKGGGKSRLGSYDINWEVDLQENKYLKAYKRPESLRFYYFFLNFSRRLNLAFLPRTNFPECRKWSVSSHQWRRVHSAQSGSWWGPRCEGCGPPSPPSRRADRRAPRRTSSPPACLSDTGNMCGLGKRWGGKINQKERKELQTLRAAVVSGGFRASPFIRTRRISLRMVKVVHKTNMENRKVQMGSAILYSGWNKTNKRRRYIWARPRHQKVRAEVVLKISLFSSHSCGGLRDFCKLLKCFFYFI